MMAEKKVNEPLNRREFVRGGLRTASALTICGSAGALFRRASSEELVWQLDPSICMQCGKCALNCVLAQSAVKCIHSFSMCGYCDLCSGYLQPGAKARDTGAESQLCPTGAIRRKFVEAPYFEYTIDEKLCVGCGKCVKACGAFGNGSLYLQARHDRCENCNDCSIARLCPAQAWKRIPAAQAYLLRGDESLQRPRKA